MAISQKYSRVQKKGQVTIPAEMREKLGLKEGDLVAFIETEDGILISPQEVLALRALDRIGAALKEQGISLDELIEAGRGERSTIVKEEYDLSEEA
ncbi:MAG: AbrB/MazE/SpoVT family DNA-binding domain-containing protein [Caldilineaceae bacterium]|nr:AbrB/MazE/SpoVT family DNA-binding domain-containing protein [Caldilineaceae bacterium]